MDINKLNVKQFSNLELRASEHADAVLIIKGEDGETVATGLIYETGDGGYLVILIHLEEDGFMVLCFLNLLLYPFRQHLKCSFSCHSFLNCPNSIC
jgi:hypothetical protein